MKHKIACTHNYTKPLAPFDVKIKFTNIKTLPDFLHEESKEVVDWALDNGYMYCDGECDSVDNCPGGWMDDCDYPVDIVELYLAGDG
jgi:hypothetical protein